MQDDDNYLAEALLWQGRVFALAAMIIYIYMEINETKQNIHHHLHFGKKLQRLCFGNNC
jgi:hypothetical protein